jgi:hypothetical protein
LDTDNSFWYCLTCMCLSSYASSDQFRLRSGLSWHSI